MTSDTPSNRSTLEARLGKLVRQWDARRLLVIGDSWPNGVTAADLEITHVRHGRPLEVGVKLESRFDVAVLLYICQPPDWECFERLVAQLRDIQAQRLIVVLPAKRRVQPSKGLGDSQMLALGLDALGEAESQATVVELYGFDIDRYKKTPDWLNARNWANPENWGKFRW